MVHGKEEETEKPESWLNQGPSLSCQCYIAQTSPFPRPYFLMRKNGLANQVKFLGLVC